MKFLVLQKPIPGPPPTPEQMKAISQALDASIAIMEDQKKKGKVECSYGLAGTAGGFAIVDVDSHEELNEQIATIPITAFGQIEVYPLIDLKSASETLKKSIAQSPK